MALRYFNVAGASRRNGEQHDPETHLIPSILGAVEADRPLTVFGTDYPTPDGTNVRDYIHVEDLADAHLAALEATDPDDPRTADPDAPGDPARGRAVAINLGSAAGFSVREVIAAAERVVGRPIPTEAGPRRPGDPPILVASNERARDGPRLDPAARLARRDDRVRLGVATGAPGRLRVLIDGPLRRTGRPGDRRGQSDRDRLRHGPPARPARRPARARLDDRAGSTTGSRSLRPRASPPPVTSAT